jgi:hypothetical protein
MPSYRCLSELKMCYSDLDDGLRSKLWEAYRALLAEADDRLADPVAYSLWVDFFEDPRTEAWAEMTASDLGRKGLERLLDASGPVPYELKEPLYERLAADPAWHAAVFRGLLYSYFDYYGKIDRAKAARLLEQLQLAPETRDWLSCGGACSQRTGLRRPCNGTAAGRLIVAECRYLGAPAWRSLTNSGPSGRSRGVLSLNKPTGRSSPGSDKADSGSAGRRRP